MADWIETYRGVVNAWECDVVEHFTIAYYFDRFADASANFLDLIGQSEMAATSRLHVTFRHELRAGSQFHILSAITAIDEASLRLGHQVLDSTSGESVTFVAETRPLPRGITPATRQRLAAMTAAWPGPEVPDRKAALSTEGLATTRDRVKPWEIGEGGALSLPGQVHRFSAAAMQTLAAIGMTATYMQEQRRGFSTFEIDLHLLSAAKTGDIVDITTVVTHLGNSSVRFLHTMSCKGSGKAIASMVQSGVQLDLDARRSTPFPAELRALASKLLVPQQG